MQDLVRSRKMKRQKWEVTSEQPYLNLKTFIASDKSTKKKLSKPKVNIPIQNQIDIFSRSMM